MVEKKLIKFKEKNSQTNTPLVESNLDHETNDTKNTNGHNDQNDKMDNNINEKQKQKQKANLVKKENPVKKENLAKKSKIVLITQNDLPKIPNVQGEVRYNSETHEWEGNEKELEAFEQKGPVLISNLDSTMTFTEFNGMKFNTNEHRWEGNDEEIDWGGSSEDEEFLKTPNHVQPDQNNISIHSCPSNSRYQTRDTFLLSQETLDIFEKSEKSNTSLMRNWTVDESLIESKFSIRKFSIPYIIEKSKFL
ncbi:mitotic check point protein bfa1 [Anaeramoeba flamelloides]|uniref:Mitotic check point protein bfa1 n=1 Tax=Anaeramoeba flamelloides TaxID=1746091 RepID=A0AAV7YMA3_9EUKA|nr:mitotic check point protein bfa1 [Anaeramoeba flamelloides]